MPRNVHPFRNEGRRKARAVAILEQIKQQGTRASFVDTEEYSDGKKFAIIVFDSNG